MPARRKPAEREDVAAEPKQQSWNPGLLVRLVFDVAGVAVGVWYTVLAVELGAGTAADPGPGFFPRVVGALIVACLLFDLVVAIRAATRGRKLRGSGRLAFGPLGILVAIGLYFLVVEYMGHAVTSVLVSVLLLAVLGERKWWVIGLVGLVAGFASDLMFTALLGVRLPLGKWDIGWSAWT